MVSMLVDTFVNAVRAFSTEHSVGTHDSDSQLFWIGLLLTAKVDYRVSPLSSFVFGFLCFLVYIYPEWSGLDNGLQSSKSAMPLQLHE